MQYGDTIGLMIATEIYRKSWHIGIIVSHEAIRSWCHKFCHDFKEAIKKRERNPKNKSHLDEMTVKLNGISFILWEAVDFEDHELDMYLQGCHD